MRRVSSQEVTEAAQKALSERGVSIEDIAEIVYEMQGPFNHGLTIDDCIESVNMVLLKREIQHALLVAVELDRLAEEKKLSEPLQSLIDSDEGLFGIDETIAIGASLGYGSIAVTTFGHLDKNKIGIIRELDTKKGVKVNTFLDDMVAAIAATAAARVAHKARDKEESVPLKNHKIKEEW